MRDVACARAGGRKRSGGAWSRAARLEAIHCAARGAPRPRSARRPGAGVAGNGRVAGGPLRAKAGLRRESRADSLHVARGGACVRVPVVHEVAGWGGCRCGGWAGCSSRAGRWRAVASEVAEIRIPPAVPRCRASLHQQGRSLRASPQPRPPHGVSRTPVWQRDRDAHGLPGGSHDPGQRSGDPVGRRVQAPPTAFGLHVRERSRGGAGRCDAGGQLRRRVHGSSVLATRLRQDVQSRPRGVGRVLRRRGRSDSSHRGHREGWRQDGAERHGADNGGAVSGASFAFH